MNSGLDQACAILDEFEKEITGVQAIWKELANRKKKLSAIADTRNTPMLKRDLR